MGNHGMKLLSLKLQLSKLKKKLQIIYVHANVSYASGSASSVRLEYYILLTGKDAY